MAWQPEVGSGSARAVDNQDLLTKLVQFACSQHVATVAVNAGGSGYVVGDVVTLTHASAHLDARFEVTSVSGGAITGLRIVASGAFAQQAVSATVSAGGSGYAVGDILQVQGGTSRLKAKFKVSSVSGGAVTGVTLFEGGGAYSATPSNPASTKGVGPSTFAGDDLCTLTVTYQTLIGTTALAVTGGSGTGATVDITLAETGWTADRDDNKRVENSVDGEKEVVLKGDASGKNNKPYVGFITWSRTSGVNTRYGVSVFGMAAHNPASDFHLQPAISAGINTGTGALSDGPNIPCDEDKIQEMDFWFSVDDQRLQGVVNINSGAASTDNGEYMHFHLGLMNAYGTETENPYPMMVGASGRALNIDPSTATTNISGLPECIGPSSSNTGWWFYEAENSVWRNIENGENLAASSRPAIAYPMGHLSEITDANSPDRIVTEGVIDTFSDWSNVTRSAPAMKLWPVLGTTSQFFLWPVNIIQRRGSASANNVEDGPRGEVRGWYWVSATDATGAKVVNFSEDYITVGSDRYRVFHNHVHTERYQYIAIKEDV